MLEHSGLKASNLYIAQIKQKCGIIERANYNMLKLENAKQPQCPPEIEKAIKVVITGLSLIIALGSINNSDVINEIKTLIEKIETL